MNLQEISTALNNCLKELNASNIDDESKLDLELLVIQLKRQMRLAVFDPLRDLDNVTIADLSKLNSLVDDVKVEIANEKQRVVLVTKIVTLAKVGLKAAGLPIPS